MRGLVVADRDSGLAVRQALRRALANLATRATAGPLPRPPRDVPTEVP